MSAARCLSHVKPAIPLLMYFILKLCMIIAYSATQWIPPRWLLDIIANGIAAEQFARYPDRMILMPLFLTRIEIPLEILVLSFVYGLTIFLVASARKGEAISLERALSSVSPRWPHLALAYLVSSTALFVVVRIPAILTSNATGVSYSMQFLLAAIVGIVAQSFLAYAGTLVVIEKRTGLDSVKSSAFFAGHHLVESLLLVAIPFVVSLPVLLLSLNPSAIASQLSPDFLVIWQIAAEAIDMVMGYFLVGAATIFLMQSKEKERTS